MIVHSVQIVATKYPEVRSNKRTRMTNEMSWKIVRIRVIVDNYPSIMKRNTIPSQLATSTYVVLAACTFFGTKKNNLNFTYGKTYR